MERGDSETANENTSIPAGFNCRVPFQNNLEDRL